MKKYVLCSMSTIFLLFIMCISVIAAENPKIDAVVNGFPIYSVEVEQEVLTVLPMSAGFHGKMPPEKMNELRKEALQRLIDLELKFQDARAKNLQLSSGEREAAIKKVSGRFNSKDEFEAAIKDAGFTREIFEHFVERPLLTTQISKKEIEDKVSITDDMVTKYYDSNKSRYSKPKAYRASHILFKIDPSIPLEEKKKVRTRAEMITKKIKDGADFGDIAAKESEDLSFIKGGDLGYFHAGQILDELEKTLDTMKVGEVSGLIESLYGLHLVKLTDMQSPRRIPFEEIKDKIKKDLIDSEKKRLMEQWISSINNKAVITYPAAK